MRGGFEAYATFPDDALPAMIQMLVAEKWTHIQLEHSAFADRSALVLTFWWEGPESPTHDD